jgi:hypothetical protein
MEKIIKKTSTKFFCECCEDKGFIEVTHADNKEYIEACEECDFFGIIGNEQNDKAQIKAIKAGYKLGCKGEIL